VSLEVLGDNDSAIGLYKFVYVQGLNHFVNEPDKSHKRLQGGGAYSETQLEGRTMGGYAIYGHSG
jgi:hypothetical protein